MSRSNGLGQSGGHSLEWERLPRVGADRHAGRGRFWQRFFLYGAVLWLCAAAAIAAWIA